MSRIGKQPVKIPTGVTVEINGNKVKVKGSKGELEKNFHPNMKIEVQNDAIVVTRSDETKLNKSLHGLTRSLLSNMVEGVTKGFEKKLEIVGVGYRANPSKNNIKLSLGFSHDIDYKAAEGIEITMDEEKKNIIIIRGIDKEAVGETAANIRGFKKPEPYKGKGIKYIDEQIRRKAGKAASKSSK